MSKLLQFLCQNNCNLRLHGVVRVSCLYKISYKLIVYWVC